MERQDTWFDYFWSRARMLFVRFGRAFGICSQFILWSSVALIILAWTRSRGAILPIEVLDKMISILSNLIVFPILLLGLGLFGTLFFCSLTQKGRTRFDKRFKLPDVSEFEHFRAEQQKFNKEFTERLDKIDDTLKKIEEKHIKG